MTQVMDNRYKLFKYLQVEYLSKIKATNLCTRETLLPLKCCKSNPRLISQCPYNRECGYVKISRNDENGRSPVAFHYKIKQI